MANIDLNQKTADELLEELFRVEYEKDPDGDPGPLLIRVSADAKFVTIEQHDEVLSVGDTLAHALARALERVRG